jgi:transposase-like protein
VSLTSSCQASLDASDYRLRHLRDQADSGLSVAEYCRRRELCANTFYNWRRLHRERGPSAALRTTVSFTEIGRVSVQTQWAAEIVLASGAVVRVSAAADAQLLRALVEALG